MTDKEYTTFSDYIKNESGIYLGTDKKQMVVARLRAVMTSYSLSSYKELLQLLILDKNVNLGVSVVNAISTNYTYFMREPEHFVFLRDKVIPSIKLKNISKDIKVWCSACSTGEEAYTLAFIIDDALGMDRKYWQRSLLATDISTEVLNKCVRGEYSIQSIKALSDDWVKRYFESVGNDRVLVSGDIKKQVIFKRFNLIDSRYPFREKFDIIFCRNVMIYFDDQTKDGIIKKFHMVLNKGGYLFVGHSEGFDCEKFGFEYVMPSVYRRV